MKPWIIIKDNYVIARIMWDGVSPYEYPYPYDLMMEDTEEKVHIGDWYEQSESIFYRPLDKPLDIPEELNDINF